MDFGQTTEEARHGGRDYDSRRLVLGTRKASQYPVRWRTPVSRKIHAMVRETEHPT